MSLPPFERLLVETAPRVQRLLYALAGADEADDCFQETYLAALRAYPRLRHSENPAGWILTIAYNKARDARAARGRRPQLPGKLPDAPDRSFERDGWPWPLVAELPPMQRSALALRFAADLRYSEIGEALGCSEAAARQNVRAGLNKLRRSEKLMEGAI